MRTLSGYKAPTGHDQSNVTPRVGVALVNKSVTVGNLPSCCSLLLVGCKSKRIRTKDFVAVLRNLDSNQQSQYNNTAALTTELPQPLTILPNNYSN